LVFRLPLLERHAVDRLAALVLGEWHALGVGRVLHPVREAVAAEAGEIHHVDVLHVGARAQMLEQAPERSSFELGAGLIVHIVLRESSKNIVVPAANATERTAPCPR